jgi:hypothetical protein
MCFENGGIGKFTGRLAFLWGRASFPNPPLFSWSHGKEKIQRPVFLREGGGKARSNHHADLPHR